MIIQSMLGLAAFLFFAWLLSENRSRIPIKIVFTGLILQLALGAVLLKFPFSKEVFVLLSRLATSIEESTIAGTSLVFGYLGGAELPFVEKFQGGSFILAFKALPLVLVMSALSALLFYWKVLPLLVKGVNVFFRKTMGLGGAEGLGVAANIFMGMVESPLFIRPYLKNMTRSEIFTLMTSGMATIAGTVMVLYASILNTIIPDIMGHILTASIISVPAAIIISKIMIPETGESTSAEMIISEKALSSMDALTKGTLQGIKLLVNIIAMLIVLVAVVHLINMIIGLLPSVGGEPLTLQRLLGYIMAPVVWLMGIPWKEALTAGALMGSKTVLNEFIAYVELSRIPEGVLNQRSMFIMTYAMCGFANPGSLGIMIGGLGTMVPEKRDEIISLGLRSIIAGTLATCMTGAVVGIIGV